MSSSRSSGCLFTRLIFSSIRSFHLGLALQRMHSQVVVVQREDLVSGLSASKATCIARVGETSRWISPGASVK